MFLGGGEGEGSCFFGGRGEGRGRRGGTDIKSVRERKSISQCTPGLRDVICDLVEFCAGMLWVQQGAC